MRGLAGLAMVAAVFGLALESGCGGTPQPRQRPAPPVEPASTPAAGTVPITLDHDRILIGIEVVASDGRVVPARAWVDTGTDAMTLSESLAHELGLDTSGLEQEGGHGSVEVSSSCPEVRIGGVALNTSGIPLRVYPGSSTQRGLAAGVHLAAGVFRASHVVFDYPARLLTVAAPGAREPIGEPVPCRVNSATGLIMIEASIGGAEIALGVDTGSAGTWVSRELTSAWQAANPDRPVVTGALGSTNFFGFDFEVEGTLMSLPEVRVGSLVAHDVAVLGLPQGMFDWYSRKSAAPVAGFLGGNALRGFRLEVDWPAGLTWWRLGPDRSGRDLDIVGLTLRPEADGSFSVARVVEQDGRPSVAGVQAEDRLLRVGSLETTGASMGDVVDALRGAPDDLRRLELERNGSRFTVDARVRRLP